MTFHYRYRKQIIIGIIIFIIIGCILSLSIYHFLKEDKKEKEEPIILEKKEKKEVKSKDSEEEYKVDIKGEITMPGIYTLKANSRIIDVIELAGGLTEEANTSVINLSKKITDEMVIIIYSNEQVKDFEKTKEIEKLVQEKCQQPDENSLKNDACISNSNETPSSEITNNGKVSINTASKEELMTLPGIGESKAKDIIAYREANGPFKSIEDITKVSGIGENTLAQIKENITVKCCLIWILFFKYSAISDTPINSKKIYVKRY